ncbi:MAG: hypothetical protein ACRYGA_14515 [Janthinobacterium lividum]
MDTEVTIGLGILTTIFTAMAICLANPDNRIPFAIHILFVNGIAYLIANFT